ncbi:hypothetical protein H7F51_06505 [Novosphingobium flavum]|uniref:Uncharacterized protein n=1 Tax=Novosphingobium flavum TaxID=1778672 RepID=A0A7X1FQN9_9SPHN|nr:hypothetical protein [Novosphingobium flavum]MBC2665163.1 hypothetical protein [Novosphingobium flavum]
MTLVPLALGPLEATGFRILRSGVRWLVADGQWCEKDRPIGYFNVSLEPAGRLPVGQPRFADEMDLQVAFAPRVSGRLKLDDGHDRGGYLNIRSIEPWDPAARIAHVETGEAPDDGTATTLRLLMLAGRRMTALADVHSGLLPGWHSRSRGWWGEPGETPRTLLSLGVCDVAGVVLGGQAAFTEMFEMARGALQMVHVPDHPIAPCVPILIDQLERTPAQYEAIARDIHGHFGALADPLTADDWIFLGAVLAVLKNCPIRDRHDAFTSGGLQQLGPAEAVILSLAVEPQSILRHRRLGYHMHVMRHHQAAAGPAVRSWLASAFETVKRPVEAIRRDYETLVDLVRKQTGARIMCLNRMSTSGHEDIASYLGFDAPLSDTLSTVAAKEMNVMLSEVAASHGLDVIDLDAAAAEIGGAEHVPDGIHQSGLLQTILRREILDLLEAPRA